MVSELRRQVEPVLSELRRQVGTQVLSESRRQVVSELLRRVLSDVAAAMEETEGGLLIPSGVYCPDTVQSMRRKTRTMYVGDPDSPGCVKMGSEHPIVRQTMLCADTNDIEAVTDEAKRCADAGAQLVRITVQGLREAASGEEIKNKLVQDGYADLACCADIHFNPKAALRICDSFEKVRVNPGNYADGRKKFEDKVYSDEEQYQMELDMIEEIFTPLVLKAKELGRAMRIGTNHGSLSARTLSYFGDTPAGMVESAFEFARICRKHDYHNFNFSMKASNPLVMVQAYRLLAAEQYKLGWDYPLHLGVTEAGEGEDGRMKSAIGIGALLLDGLGDTIRVSLTEAAELEMSPCSELAKLGEMASGFSLDGDGSGMKAAVPYTETTRDFKSFGRREGCLPEQRDGDSLDFRSILHRDGSVLVPLDTDKLAENPDVVYSELGCKLVVGMPFKDIATADTLVLRCADGNPVPTDEKTLRSVRRLQEAGIHVMATAAELRERPLPGAIAMVPLAEASALMEDPIEGCERHVVMLDGTEDDAALKAIEETKPVFALLNTGTVCGNESRESRVHTSRRVFDILIKEKLEIPVIHHLVFEDDNDFMADSTVISIGAGAGGLLVDGLGDGVLLDAPTANPEDVRRVSFGLLQGSRMRSTKTDFVSCPSCGRTLFDLQEVTAQIAEKTGHLPGVAIAIMGCIVNGPGEMADADFGYVGSLPGKIDLYVGKEVVERGIPNEEACDRLVELIKTHGRWVDKDDEQEAKDAEKAAAKPKVLSASGERWAKEAAKKAEKEAKKNEV
eukprot:gene22742-27455_t